MHVLLLRVMHTTSYLTYITKIKSDRFISLYHIGPVSKMVCLGSDVQDDVFMGYRFMFVLEGISWRAHTLTNTLTDKHQNPYLQMLGSKVC